MIPVSLRLKNFMSYGAEAPELDFEQFHVACLSGDNGQGKSALLDAMTWALWGKARKATSRLNPAQDLLRVGQSEMQVEFVFDIEGGRYRVLRSFHRTRTSAKPHLELHGKGALDGKYRPLTGARISETQQHITNVIGLDYDTFINSAFLLQGRSDEFTKKPPGERKDILTRILSLSRYEELRQVAMAGEREAGAAIDQAEADIGRLTKSLNFESQWKERHVELRGQIARKDGRLAAARKEEQMLFGRVTQLRARQQEAESLERDLGETQERLREHEEDAALLRGSIALADALISDSDTIKSQYESALKLESEREKLDQEGELFLGLERQREQLKVSLAKKRHDLERRLDRLNHKLQTAGGVLKDIEKLMEEAPILRRKLNAALDAQEQVAKLRNTKEESESLDERIQACQQEQLRERDILASRVKTLEERNRSEESGLANLPALEQRKTGIGAVASRRESCREAMEETRQQGVDVAAAIETLSGRLQARTEELTKRKEQAAYLSANKKGQCPTCGARLTPQHRAEVDLELRAAITALEQSIAGDQRRKKDLSKTRESLRSAFKARRQEADDIEKAATELAGLKEKIQHNRARLEDLAERRSEALKLRRQLESSAFGEELALSLAKYERRRRTLTFDEDTYERVRHSAAQVDRFSERMKHIEAQSARKEPLRQSIGLTEGQRDTFRWQLDAGEAYGDLQVRIAALSRSMEDVGYDASRLHAVKQELSELREAPRRMADLANALGDRETWRRRLAGTVQRTYKARLECAARSAQIARLQEEISQMQSLEEQLKEKTQACAQLDEELGMLRISFGQIGEKLDKCADQRRRRKRSRTKKARAQKEHTLYRHLMDAFGKNGIPTLIIEETLPEIERRTNDLLKLLSDGKMSVRIDTLRSRKKGGTIETLEIKINDELGEFRAYETFSGGEAFRVNFALRIALAQLLAARSGVRVRTLIIDEGFGTQDQHGVQHLIEAIYAIQDDFNKIIVISHLSEVKNAFPVRIEVEKLPATGSRFDVIGV